MQAERWYPSVETLQDGSIIILGGMRNGGYVNINGSDEPTIEYFPSKNIYTPLEILQNTMPCNLYPLTWLLPSGKLLIQSNLQAEIYDWKTNVEEPLPNIPNAVRVYPASAATAMFPLTPANKWTATILFCGGTNLQPDQWPSILNDTTNQLDIAADASCVSITPDVSQEWVDEGQMSVGRSMGQFINLPDGRLFHFNGGETGTAGYNNPPLSWTVGQSVADRPLYAPSYYDPSQPLANRWQRPASLMNMTVPRLYHSSATLLADGSIMNAGSNPNADYIPYTGYVDDTGTTYTYNTEYRVEMFYPDYYDQPRPAPTGLPTNLTYGGPYFNISLSATDLANSISNINTVKVVVMRTGYSTHAMNMVRRLDKCPSDVQSLQSLYNRACGWSSLIPRGH